jgi:8-oxo-dGTP diphosphatase
MAKAGSLRIVHPSKVKTRTKPVTLRRAFSVSIYCRNKGAILLIRHKRLKMWLPIGGEMLEGETPLEAATRECIEETGLSPYFPRIHHVIGAPPGLLLYEEHDAGSKGVHMNFAFIAEISSRNLAPCSEYDDVTWLTSIAETPEESPLNVREALPYALAAGVR